MTRKHKNWTKKQARKRARAARRTKADERLSVPEAHTVAVEVREGAAEAPAVGTAVPATTEAPAAAGTLPAAEAPTAAEARASATDTPTCSTGEGTTVAGELGATSAPPAAASAAGSAVTSVKLAELNDLLDWAKRSPFYGTRLPSEPLSSLDDLARIPITTKKDVRAQSPFGLVCVSPRKRYDYYESFGTTGKPVSVWLTRDDVKATARQVASLGVDLGPEDVVLVRFPYAISQIAHVFSAGAHLRRACVIPASSRSSISPFTRIIHMMTELRVTVLACLPLQALLLAETAQLMGLDPGRDFPHLRAICTAGEPLPAPRRALLEALWNVPIYDVYGMTEIGTAAVDGPCRKMHPIEDDFIFEVLDDDLSGPVEPGQVGRLVITALRRRATPMIRYLTGDRARLVHERCSCGATTRLELRGRSTDALIVNRRLLDLVDLEEIAAVVPGRRLWAAGPTEVGTGVRLVVETVYPSSGVDATTLQRLEQAYGVTIRIEPVPVGTLYDRSELLAVSEVGKPRYVYSQEEMAAGAFLHRRQEP